MTVWIASDWHLVPESPAEHVRLARAFLGRAREAGVRIVLNGDVFDALFAGEGRTEAAHPEIAGEIAALAGAGRLSRTAGNHDPAAGPERLVIDVPPLGRVLVAHGHAADPVNRSPIGRLGDGISRRFGRLALVRVAARAVEAAARALAEERMLAVFRRRCLALVAREGCALGVFGHVHVPHVVAGDPYVNAGGIAAAALSYVVLDDRGARLATLRLRDAVYLPEPPARPGGRAESNEPEMR